MVFNTVKIKILTSILLLFIAANTASDTVTFQSFVGANILNKEYLETPFYIFALGKYEKRQNRVESENYLIKSGDLFRETHEFQRGADEKIIFDFYKNQLPTDIKLLFSCEKRACGESNNWANDHFKIKQLYGLNQYQRYSAYQFNDDHFITLYSVRRGNGRVYMQMDVLREQLPTADTNVTTGTTVTTATTPQ